MKHYLLSILIVCIFALVLSGCAGGKTEEAEDSVSDTDTFISAADAPAEWNGVYRCGEGSSEKTLTINGSDSTSFHFSLEIGRAHV